MLKIYKLDDVDFKNAVSNLSFGEHVIGRGPLLKVNDKRISRNHAVIKFDDGMATITALHLNPCYFKSAQGTNMTILPLNKEMPLGDGDCFALLTEDNFWFKVRIQDETLNENLETRENSFRVKRDAESDDEESYPKKPKITNDDLDLMLDSINKIVQEKKEKKSLTSNVESTSKIQEKEEETKVDTSINSNTSQTNKETVSDDEDEPQDVNISYEEASTCRLEKDIPDGDNNALVNKPEVKDEVKKEADIANDNPTTSADGNVPKDEVKKEADIANDNPTTSADGNVPKDDEDDKPNDDNKPSTSKPRRERCWYGANCFRKNPQHKADFSHQGDDDFDSDPEDDRPICSFGAACYRRNLEHRREYRHPNRPAARPTGVTSPKKRDRPAKKAKPKTAKANDESSEDDYDLEDPFIDDSEDEYVLSSDGEYSDYEDSQEVEEESQEKRRLIKEAKRFTKKK